MDQGCTRGAAVHVNTGCIDYGDNHLGPELKEMEGLHFSHVAIVYVLSDGAAYVTGEHRLKTKGVPTRR